MKDDAMKQSQDKADFQKIEYEQKRELERKRRFTILSGSVKTITSSFHLKSGEHAYFQFETTRLADREYVKSYTQGKARSPFITGGILRGNTQIDTTTSQVRLTENVKIDSGKMLFTNRQILFVGEKQVVNIPYDEIISVEFHDSQMIIKYPQMLSGEAYKAEPDTKFYYQGIMNFLEEKKATEADIDMSDYPKYVSEEEKEARKKKAFTRNAIIFTCIATVITILFHAVSMTICIISIFVFLCLGISYPILYVSNRGTHGEYETGLQVVKTLFFWSISVMIFCFILAIVMTAVDANRSTTNQSSPITTGAQATKRNSISVAPTKEATALFHWQNLKKLDDQVISYNTKLVNQCELIILTPDLSAISNWNTNDDPTYDTLYASMENEQAYTEKISTNTKNYALWKNMADVDSKLLNDLEDIVSQCVSLSTDAQQNVSKYTGIVQSDKTTINSLMTQRKNILSELGY